MIQNLLFHTLKGIKGWSDLSLVKIDVAKVLDIIYHKRLFMICDRSYPYTLYIKYAEPKEYIGTYPVIGTNGTTGIGITHNVTLTQVITKRYRSEKEVQEEINQIAQKQNKLNDLVKSLQDKMKI
jgi:hypothetical protein